MIAVPGICLRQEVGGGQAAGQRRVEVARADRLGDVVVHAGRRAPLAVALGRRPAVMAMIGVRASAVPRGGGSRRSPGSRPSRASGSPSAPRRTACRASAVERLDGRCRRRRTVKPRCSRMPAATSWLTALSSTTSTVPAAWRHSTGAVRARAVPRGAGTRRGAVQRVVQLRELDRLGEARGDPGGRALARRGPRRPRSAAPGRCRPAAGSRLDRAGRARGRPSPACTGRGSPGRTARRRVAALERGRARPRRPRPVRRCMPQARQLVARGSAGWSALSSTTSTRSPAQRGRSGRGGPTRRRRWPAPAAA